MCDGAKRMWIERAREERRTEEQTRAHAERHRQDCLGVVKGVEKKRDAPCAGCTREEGEDEGGEHGKGSGGTEGPAEQSLTGAEVEVGGWVTDGCVLCAYNGEVCACRGFRGRSSHEQEQHHVTPTCAASRCLCCSAALDEQKTPSFRCVFLSIESGRHGSPKLQRCGVQRE